jgi:hypothetical protein
MQMNQQQEEQKLRLEVEQKKRELQQLLKQAADAQQQVVFECLEQSLVGGDSGSADRPSIRHTILPRPVLPKASVRRTPNSQEEFTGTLKITVAGLGP